MEQELKILKKKGIKDPIIQIVKQSILVAEEYISIPRSTKTTSEIIHVVNQIHRKQKK